MKTLLIYFALVAISLMLSSCITGACGERISSELQSPDKQFTATLFERDCGATTSYVAHVNLRASNTPFAPDGDGVIKQGQVFVIKGPAGSIKLSWKDAKNLEIECTGCNRNPHLAKEDHWQDITITLKTEKTDASTPTK